MTNWHQGRLSLSAGLAETVVRAAALPSHLGIGLAAQPDGNGIYGWMPQSGIPWDYAYQYLAGGANTGTGWQTWNTNAQFPLWYAQGAASHGYIPVFPYYQLLQSTGPSGSGSESGRDLAHLNSPATMASVYNDFVVLMKRLGPGTYDGVRGFGGTAVVNVEPDLSGYAMQAVLDNALCDGHCTGQSNDPALLGAAVASSGVPEAAGYPNTYQGFNLALLHIRDLYAPNVRLAFHVSDWATRHDVGGPEPNLDAAALGTDAGTFAFLNGAGQAPAGTSTYDLVFNDVADRDSAVSGVWWDRLNVTVPNFHRWEDYLGAVTRRTGRSAIVWQIPVGNQWFRTMDNSPGHRQDNRAEYFFAHIPELTRISVIGLLFGSGGNGGSTSQWDARADGVTNPPPSCTSNGLSSGQACNDHTSTVADDDGGYLRMAAQAYYTAPAPTPGPPSACTSGQLPSAVSTAYFAEGTVRGGFQEYVTLQNSGSADVTAAITFQASDDAGRAVPVPTKGVVVPANSRVTFDVNSYVDACGVPKPVNVSLRVTSDRPLLAERPLYFSHDFGFGTVDGGTDVIGAGSTSP